MSVSGVALIKMIDKEIELQSQFLFEHVSHLDISNFSLSIVKLKSVKSKQYNYSPVSGVYCIQNRISRSRFIAYSDNIFQAWSDHVISPVIPDFNGRTYSCFDFTILEHTTDPSRENYWKNFYITSIYTSNINYNCRITKAHVMDIRTRYANHEPKQDVYKDYEKIISQSGFNKIWQGITWRKIMPEVFTEKNKLFYKYGFGFSSEHNPRLKLTQDIIKDVKKMISEGRDKYLIYKKYENLFTKSYFIYTVYDKILNGDYDE